MTGEQHSEKRSGDEKLIRERLRGYAVFNAWEVGEALESLPSLTVEESVRQYLDLCRLARALAPDAPLVFLEQDIADRVEARARFRQIAEKTSGGPAH
jgi:hypothetical protein